MDQPWRFIETESDIELNCYRFLAWLQKADRALNKRALFPWKEELFQGLKYTESTLHQLNQIPFTTKTELLGFRGNPPEPVFQHQPKEKLHASLVEYLEWCKEHLEKRQELANRIEHEIVPEIQLEELGVQAINRKEGFVVLSPEKKLHLIFHYQCLPLITRSDLSYPKVKLNFFKRMSGTDLLAIKQMLCKPYHFQVIRVLGFPKEPLRETLLPILEVKLGAYLAA